jgi:hypothetical protein
MRWTCCESGICSSNFNMATRSEIPSRCIHRCATQMLTQGKNPPSSPPRELRTNRAPPSALRRRWRAACGSAPSGRSGRSSMPPLLPSFAASWSTSAAPLHDVLGKVALAGYSPPSQPRVVPPFLRPLVPVTLPLPPRARARAAAHRESPPRRRSRPRRHGPCFGRAFRPAKGAMSLCLRRGADTLHALGGGGGGGGGGRPGSRSGPETGRPTTGGRGERRRRGPRRPR